MQKQQRIGTTAESDAPVRLQVLVHACDLMAILVPVRDDLTVRALGLAGERWTRMVLLLYSLV